VLLGLVTAGVTAQGGDNCSGRGRIGSVSRGGSASRLCDGRGAGGERRERPAGLSISVPLTQMRSIDGSSEDARAQAGATLMRLTTAAYPDGVGDGMDEEPSARLISNLVASSDGMVGATVDDSIMEQQEQHAVSDMIWIWGQFLDHDIDLTEGVVESYTIMSPDCDNDVICMIPFTRSEYIVNDVDGTREQINRVTSFIDASNVYGSDHERADALRTFQRGLLKVEDGNMLPYNVEGLENAASASSDPTKMILAGDVRANEQIGLTAMHTLFVREHNRLAVLLRETFPYSTDEQLYQMARKIVGAEIQRITYNEFLPILMGPLYGSSLETYTGYDPDVDPAIATEFSTVAFRVGHTMLSPTLLMHEQQEDISLMDAFFNPDLIMSKTENMDILLAGFCHQNAQPVDPVVIDEVRNFLFGTS
jgi:peroxidase